ncbi:hypothetical protein [Arthrobacter rhombi]|uniref:hypothetical protein n=1 Tax=Arthrobacter rhombi TaxID=71253 RepID=UPI003FCF75D4
MALKELERSGIDFCSDAPHQDSPFSKRNWGGQLHSLCSYQGKLKPSIAHFLVTRFTEPGARILDPMAGVGTIPLEARRTGRVGLAGDLSRLAWIVSIAKLINFDAVDVWKFVDALEKASLVIELGNEDAVPYSDFGLNRPISEYFHPKTLSELVSVRAALLEAELEFGMSPELAVVWTAMLHILHGNRPYALSRRSHPITPFAPRGETEYRPVFGRLRSRLSKVLPFLSELESDSVDGDALLQGYEKSNSSFGQVDAVITSPPFAESLRFWSTNWMRLWFAGWEPDDFQSRPGQFLEAKQARGMSVYSDFSDKMADVLVPGGTLILHLGQTKTMNMASEIVPLLEPKFEIAHVGTESVENGESHGLRDKGATVAHSYVFARKK